MSCMYIYTCTRTYIHTYIHTYIQYVLMYACMYCRSRRGTGLMACVAPTSHIRAHQPRNKQSTWCKTRTADSQKKKKETKSFPRKLVGVAFHPCGFYPPPHHTKQVFLHCFLIHQPPGKKQNKSGGARLTRRNLACSSVLSFVELS